MIRRSVACVTNYVGSPSDVDNHFESAVSKLVRELEDEGDTITNIEFAVGQDNDGGAMEKPLLYTAFIHYQYEDGK